MKMISGRVTMFVSALFSGILMLYPNVQAFAQTDAAITRFEDYQKIQNVLKRYIVAIDTEDEGLYGLAFAAEDAVLEIRGVTHHGREEIKKEITKVKQERAELEKTGKNEPLTTSFHMMSNSNIIFIDETIAHHHAYYLVYTRENVMPGVRNTLPIVLRAIGRYDDELVKVGNEWFIQRRLITPDTSGGF